MSHEQEIQQTLFEQVERSLPEHVALVDEVSALLEVSRDSAYRRIRGEKLLSLPELRALCTEYGLSTDALFQVEENNIIFQYYPLGEEGFDYSDYLQNILQDLEWIRSFEEVQVIYATDDMPLFQLLQVPELAAFKFFFWMKTTIGFERYEDKPFSVDELSPIIDQYRQPILERFVKIPSIDILGEEMVNSFIKQIDYYQVSGFFEDEKEAPLLCDQIIELLHHLQKQAELGRKFVYGKDPPTGAEENYQLYYNNVVSTDNAILVKTDEHYTTYVTNNAVNYMQTTNPSFYQNTRDYLDHLMSKSSLISSVSEKERNQFFRQLKEKVNEFRQSLD